MSMYKTFHAKRNKLLQLVQDPETQDIYVGGRNKIYQLDSMLNHKHNITVCKKKCQEEIDNNIVVLEIVPFSNYLFVCGTVNQGACVKYNLANIHNSTDFSTNRAENFVGSKTSTVAFFAADSASKTFVLYVAMSYDGRKIEYFPKIMSERIISKSKKGLYSLDYRKSYLGIPTNKAMLDIYPVKFIYGFKHNNFIYYVSLQGQQTYIGRVCEKSEFYYYVEISLKCWHEKTSWSYATAAKFISNKTNENLVVTYWNKNVNMSLFCIHSMREIQNMIRNAIENCYKLSSKDLPKIPSWIKANESCAETYEETITTDTCGYDEHNGYISGATHLALCKFVYTEKITAIQSYVYEGTYIYILGTSNGHLLKIANIEKFQLIMDNDISQGRGEPIQKDMELDTNKTHVYVMSGSNVIRFPLKSCSIYTNCSSCVTSNHPLNCGWCHDKCTTSNECSNGWSPDSCVPQITSIRPIKGPVEGGTKLTIKGKYFTNGINKMEITVKVGNVPCSVKEYNATTIICNTSKDNKHNKKGNIHVKIRTISTQTNQLKIEGEDISKEIFYFLVPEIYNFTPTSGPISGGTQCNITGNNLDIGSTYNLYIGDKEVLIQMRTQDKIIARTKKVNSLITNQLKLQIDGKTLFSKNSYSFKPDPTITNVEHSTNTIKSGGIEIVFIGENLNTVQNPMLSGVVVKTKAHLPAEKCTANKDGTKLYCKTPTLNDSSSDTISVDLRLHMDGVIKLYNFATTYPKYSRINYYNDPVLYKFDSEQNIFFYGKTTKPVVIKGNYITDIVKKEDINITIGYRTCPITSLTNKAIYCKPSSVPPENANQHKFQVKIGYRNYNIGWLIFTSSSSAQVNILIIVLIVILISVVIVITTLFYYMWKKKLLFFKERRCLPTARYTTNDQVHFGENGRLITAGNEYTERQNFQPATTVDSGATNCPGIDENILLVLGDKKLLIPKESLQITEKIGQGHFGRVYRALYRKPGEKGEMCVAVKTLHKDHPRDMDVQGFLDEALIMKDFDHENILSLIGICLGKDHMPLVVLPYMAHGDLLSYLRNVNNQPTVKDLIVFGISIASGMDYLASLKFVHRDLAARNCMLNDKLIVKVADFGLSRDIYERDYYSSDNKKSKLPVKWMALESLENGTYNTKTDVWSYGVVLWELFTRGVNPYPTVDNWDMPKYLKLGRRMDKPDYCPNRIYDIMLRCWEFDQNLRPDFATIINELTELSEMEKHKDLPCYQKTPYENVEY